MSNDVIYHLITSQRALLDTIEAQILNKSKEAKGPSKDRELPSVLHADAISPEDEEFYIDYIEQERQALIREAAKNHRAKEEPEPETEEEDLEPVILPHIVDRMETQEKSQSGRLNQSELMADLNI